MKNIHVAKDPVSANLLKELLADAGIQAAIQNERVFALYGGVRAFNPAVCVPDEHYEAGRKIAAEFERSQTSPSAPETWTCPKCGEKIEGRYEECWKCDAEGQESEQRGGIAETLPLRRKLLWAAVLVLLAVLFFIILCRPR